MAKTVHFVIGLPHAGKSVAIASDPLLSTLPKLDLRDVQLDLAGGDERLKLSEDEVWESYLIARDRLLELMEEHDECVFEHTLVKAKRRPMYLDAIRETFPEARIVCHYVYPPLEEYEVRHAGGQEKFEKMQEIWKMAAESFPMKTVDMNRVFAKANHKIFDVPTIEEGFDEVIEMP